MRLLCDALAYSVHFSYLVLTAVVGGGMRAAETAR